MFSAIKEKEKCEVNESIGEYKLPQVVKVVTDPSEFKSEGEFEGYLSLRKGQYVQLLSIYPL